MDKNVEYITRDEQKLAELIGTLKRVEAPGDFDSRVRARIAARRTKPPRTLWRPVIAAAAVGVVLAFAGYIAFRSIGPDNAPTAREIANTSAGTPPHAVATQPLNSAPTPVLAPDNTETVATTRQRKDNRMAPAQPQGGSLDEASKVDRKLFVRTFDPSQRRIADTSAIGGGQIPVAVVFEAIGLHVAWSSSGWRVESVNAKSVAGRGGVRAGDVIEAIDGRPVGEKTTFKDSIIGRSLRVRRDGASIEIPFKP